MGKGFGRGAKSVAIVTHAQVKHTAKTPRGLRGGRAKRRRTHTSVGEQVALEESLGVVAGPRRPAANNKSKKEAPSLAQQIASIQFPTQVNKRQKGFKQLRRQIMDAVKVVRRQRVQKNSRKMTKMSDVYAAKYEMEMRRK